MDRVFALIASLLGASAVAVGAFGAHALQERVSQADLEIFETGSRYHLTHALALFGVAWAVSRWPDERAIVIGGWLIFAGTIVFSGSLYALVLSGVRTLGAITPIGGVLIIAGWLAVAYALFRAG